MQGVGRESRGGREVGRSGAGLSVGRRAEGKERGGQSEWLARSLRGRGRWAIPGSSREVEGGEELQGSLSLA